MNDPRVLAIKAHALLVPSPYAKVDPNGEPARRQAIEAYLASAGVKASEADQRHVELCAKEAHDALVLPEDLPEASGFPSLRHPLSARPLGSTARVRNAGEYQAELLNTLPAPSGPADARWYARLWRALMIHQIYRETPAEPRLPDHTVAAHRSLTAAIAGARLDGDRPALIALHVGPVQSFIEAARRTHDLSLGSYTVGFLAFTAALSIAEELGPDALLNPDVSCRALADRLLFDEPIDPKRRPELLRAALMNKVTALVPDRRAEDIARRAMKAASDRWSAMGEATTAHLAKYADPERDLDGFEAQIKQHLEVDAVVQRWHETDAKLMDLFEGAKVKPPEGMDRTGEHPGAACGVLMNLTDEVLGAHRKGVPPQAGQGDQRPKCTVCGLREQMGPIEEHRWRQQGETRQFFEKLSEELQERESRAKGEPRASLQIVHGEGLCAVCLTKRFLPELHYGASGGGLGIDWNERNDRPLLRFPSTATIASAPLRLFLRDAGPRHRTVNEWVGLLGQLHARDALDFTPPGNLLAGLGDIGDRASVLGYDGVWLYDDAYDLDVAWRGHFSKPMKVEQDPEQDEKREQRRKRIEELIGPALKAFNRARGVIDKKSASSYYAVIVVDGDKMGDWKSGRHERTPTFDELAPGAPEPWRNQKRPIHPALHGELSQRVARLGLDLHAIVDQHLGRIVYHGGDDLLAFLPLATVLPCLGEIQRSFRTMEHLGERVTISAGVAITHWREPLSRALAAARKAEKKAKETRDCFAIHVDKRSGEDLEIVLPWTLGPFDVLEEIQGAIDHEEDKEPPLASAKAAYRLRDELPTLRYRELRDPFKARVRDLIVPASPDGSSAYRLIAALLSHADKRMDGDPASADVIAEGNAKEIVDLLLFLRFLLREEHGISTRTLLRKLPKKEATL